MANTIFSIDTYKINSDDVFFFDNNIWMYLLCSIGNFKEHKQRSYSNFLNYVQQRKNPIFVNSLLLSEFSNRYLKLEYDILRYAKENAGKYNDYKKDFVGSTHYQSIVAEIKIQLKNILKICEKCSDEFNSINTDAILNVFTGIGFNDSYYLHLAKKKNWIIVSDDSDFTNNKAPNLGIKILTYQRKSNF